MAGEPTLLLYRGRTLEPAMRRQRVTRSEVEAACRESGLGSVSEADAVLLETDGSLSVIPRDDARGPREIAGVKAPD